MTKKNEEKLTPKSAYDNQKRQAASRGIPWLFTYEDWLEVWLVSGKWLDRGRSPEQFCMCRYGDVGPYSLKNCFISTNEHNQRERWEGKEKVTNPTALAIIDLYLNTESTQAEVAKTFGVDQSYVSRIVSKKRKKIA